MSTSSPPPRPRRPWWLAVAAVCALSLVPWPHAEDESSPAVRESEEAPVAVPETAVAPRPQTRDQPDLGRLDRGAVVSSSGEPLAGVQVFARAADGPEQDDALLATTDERGEFVVLGLPDGAYELTLHGPSIFSARTRWQVPGPPIRIMAPRRLAIEGVVSEAGAPVEGATVSLSDGTLSRTETTTTDAAGRYAFRELPDADYVVWAWHAATASSLVLADPDGATDLSLLPASVVVGRVVDRAAGDGVAARVELIPSGSEGAARSAATAADGSFRIEGVPHGRWRVQLEAPGFIARTAYELAAERPEETIALEVVRGASVSGRVLDPHGSAVAGASVLVRGADKRSQNALELARASVSRPVAAQTPSGSIRWQHPLAGARLLPEGDGRRFGAHREGDRPEECGMGHCGVDLGHEHGAVVHAAADGVVRTVVRRASGRAGRFVSIEHAGQLRTQYMHLDQIREDLVPGTELRAGEPLGTVGITGVLRAGPHLHFTLAQQQGERTWFIDPEPMLRHALVRTAPAALAVPGLEGVPDQVVAAVRIDPVDPPAAPGAATVAYRALTGSDGRYELGGLPAGRYIVTAMHQGYARGMSNAVTVSGSGVGDLDVRLSAGVIVFGRVLDDHGFAIGGAHVVAEAGQSLDVRQVGHAIADANGYFELAPLDGAVSIRASAQAHGAAERGLTLRNRGVDVERREEVFELVMANAELRGRLRDAFDVPLVGARLTIVDGPGGQARGTVSNAAGELFIPALPAGEYQVRVDAPGYPQLRATLNTDDAFTLALEAGGGMRLDLRDAHTRAPLAAATVHAKGPRGDQRKVPVVDGLVELSALQPGRWTVVVRADGYVTGKAVVMVPAGRGPNEITVDDARIELERGAEIGGIVIDGNGERVAGAKLEIGGVELTTDQDGRFRVDQVPAGEQMLRARRGDATGSMRLVLAPGDEQVTLQLTIEAP